MLTKAIILGKELNSNKYIIRIPLLETAANSEVYKTKAVLCCEDGVLNPFNIGDVVYVSFEDNLYENPVIVGKLSLEGLVSYERNSSNVSYLMNSLQVTNKTDLSENTKIGNITYANLETLFRKVDAIDTAVNSMIWSEGVNYVENNVCLCNNFLYICKIDHTSSSTNAPGNSDYWKQVTAL